MTKKQYGKVFIVIQFSLYPKELKVCVIYKGLTVVVHTFDKYVCCWRLHLMNFNNIQMDLNEYTTTAKGKELEETEADIHKKNHFISLSDDGHHQMFFNEILQLFFFCSLARYIHLNLLLM